MSTPKSSNDANTKLKSVSNKEAVLNTFQTLREEQRQIANKLADTEMEESELKVVINTLKKIDESRKCYRLIGGILCEKTVKDVLPVLQDKHLELTKLYTKLKDDLVKKGVELNEFKEKYNVRIQSQDECMSMINDLGATNNAKTTVILNKT